MKKCTKKFSLREICQILLHHKNLRLFFFAPSIKRKSLHLLIKFMYLKALFFIIQGHILAKKSHKLTASLYARYFLFRSRSASNAFISPPRTHFFMYVCETLES